MVNAFTLPPELLIARTAKELKEKSIINPPEWSHNVKTGYFKENIPDQSDWFYIRAAAVLRKIYSKGPIGIQKLRKEFGHKNNRGSRPSRSARASGAVLRNIVRQLEKNELIAIEESNGRKISSKGMSFLDAMALSIKDDLPELKRYF